MDLVCYEHDRGFVLERFREGDFDYVDAANEVVEANFFRFIQGRRYLEELAGTYPSPRDKQEVPTWFYLASNLSMRLHGVHSFHAYPYVIRCGGMLHALGPEVAHKATHPTTGDVTLCCAGFNDKNSYERQTPCDQDYLRKLARDTRAQELEQWFNCAAARLYKKHKVYDREGIFIGDASYVFVPDNDAYEGSVRLLFDEHGHPVESARLPQMSPKAAARLQWRRCYKLVSLLHTDRARSFCLRVALRLLPGNQSECPVLYDLVEQFVADVGDDVVRRLILDRGFLDGERISRLKLKHGIDVLIPVRKNMDVYRDVEGLLGEVRFREYRAAERPPIEPPRLPQAPAEIRAREQKRQRTVARKKRQDPPVPPDQQRVRTEVGGLEGFRSWSSCTVPLNVIVNREVFADGHTETWMLLDTKPLSRDDGPAQRRDEYAIRSEIEEGHRQLKCFWDLTRFTSRAFSLVLNQVVFVLLAYNLLQIFLRAQDSGTRARRTRGRLADLLFATSAVVIIYCQSRYATLTPLEYSELVLTLSEAARRKVLARVRKLRREQLGELKPARPP